MGDEIKWVVDSKKIVNDAYGGGYISRTPEYFYSVVAYYIHRKVRGIGSWTDMMLIDTMSKWYDTMKSFGAQISFKEIEAIIEEIGNAIIRETFDKEPKGGYGDNEARPVNQDAGGLSEFANFAKQFGIDVEDIQDTAINIYRTLAKKLHPDINPPDKKAEMTEKFKELQEIWSNVPEMYKKAMSWYHRFLFG